MKTGFIVIATFQNYILPVITFILALLLAPQMDVNERLGLFSLLAQVIATLLITLALLPRFQGTPVLPWSSLLVLALGEACAVYGAVPVWSDHFWQPAFAVSISSTALAIFAVAASVGPANARKQREEGLSELVTKAKELDPDPPPQP